MAPARIQLEGRGLHTGNVCRVQLRRSDGPVGFENDNGFLPFRAAAVIRADRGVRVRCASIGLELELVEHLAGALAGLGIRDGLKIRVWGGEVPLLDGGARELTEALLSLKLPPSLPSLRVARAGRICFGPTWYEFVPSRTQVVSVTTEFLGVGVEHAAWHGSAEQFCSEIAPARTFGFVWEAAELRRAGRAAWIDRESVMVLDAGGRVQRPGKPRRPAELAQHKLLDLLGDFFLLGGPPLGTVSVFRPGHALNHLAFREALDSGIVAKVVPAEATLRRHVPQ